MTGSAATMWVPVADLVSAAEVFLVVFSVAAVVAAIGAVRSARVVHAALCLVLTLAMVAGVYLVLGAEVVALVQLLVYVGAVVVLALFALMLTRSPIGRHDDLDASRPRRWVAALAGAGTAVLIAGPVLWAVGGAQVHPLDGAGRAAAIGGALFTGWVLPFELLSVLLLAALVGAIAVSRAGRDRDAE